MCNQPDADADTVAILGGRTRTRLMDADTVEILGNRTRTRLRFEEAGRRHSFYSRRPDADTVDGHGRGCNFRGLDADTVTNSVDDSVLLLQHPSEIV